ncbi:unnamed protein product [Symbiodinium sp. CCMP2456]|nr:unnamed protein product [Symbiodinium sp. CCMP2456]
MPDSKPNDARVNLLKEFFEDLLKPGYVNQRIESLKKLHKKQKKDPEEPFRYRFLDVTSSTVSEEQVTSDFNFEVVASYCSSFAGNLPTKKEEDAEAAEDACDADEGAEAAEEEAPEEDECLGDDVESEEEKDKTRGTFKDISALCSVRFPHYSHRMAVLDTGCKDEKAKQEEYQEEACEKAEQAPERSPEPPEQGDRLSQVNRKGGASLGWNKFESLAQAPGAWHISCPVGLIRCGIGIQLRT